MGISGLIHDSLYTIKFHSKDDAFWAIDAFKTRKIGDNNLNSLSVSETQIWKIQIYTGTDLQKEQEQNKGSKAVQALTQNLKRTA